MNTLKLDDGVATSVVLLISFIGAWQFRMCYHECACRRPRRTVQVLHVSVYADGASLVPIVARITRNPVAYHRHRDPRASYSFNSTTVPSISRLAIGSGILQTTGSRGSRSWRAASISAPQVPLL